ncbi:MAG: hypothetical protein ACOZBL_00880 [Patescibacteria group bacterium]
MICNGLFGKFVFQVTLTFSDFSILQATGVSIVIAADFVSSTCHQTFIEISDLIFSSATSYILNLKSHSFLKTNHFENFFSH